MDETVPFVSLAATVGHPYIVHADCDDLQVNKHPLRVQAGIFAIAGGVRKPGAATAQRRCSCQSLGSGIQDLGLCWNVWSCFIGGKLGGLGARGDEVQCARKELSVSSSVGSTRRPCRMV